MNVRLGWGLVSWVFRGWKNSCQCETLHFFKGLFADRGTRTAFSSVLSTMFTCTEGDDVETVSKCEESPHRGPVCTACWGPDWLPKSPKIGVTQLFYFPKSASWRQIVSGQMPHSLTQVNTVRWSCGGWWWSVQSLKECNDTVALGAHWQMRNTPFGRTHRGRDTQGRFMVSSQ